MPPKKRTAPAPTEPIQWQNQSRSEREATQAIVGHFTSNLGASMNKKADQLDAEAERNTKESSAKLKRSKAARLRRAAEIAPDQPLSLTKAANNRIAAVTQAATTMRAPGESIGGAGWYYHANGDVRAHAPLAAPDTAITASSIMSPGTDPQTERRALGALDYAHAHGKVSFQPPLVAHLRAKGADVPDHVVGTTQHFRDLPGHVVMALADIDTRDLAARHSVNVSYAPMGGISSPQNLSKAHRVLSGATPLSEAQDPVAAPKTWSYTHDQKLAVPGTPEHHEYMARAAHLGDTLRGEQNGRQGMLDLWGHRSSNTGLLSNQQHTAEDNWMRGVSIGLRDPKLLKAAGDVQPGRQTFTHPETGEVTRAASVPGAAEAVYHSWNNEATQRAARSLQSRHGLEFTVPSVLVQETSWTGARRAAGGDAEFNAQQRAAQKADPRPKVGQVRGQKRLF